MRSLMSIAIIPALVSPTFDEKTLTWKYRAVSFALLYPVPEH